MPKKARIRLVKSNRRALFEPYNRYDVIFDGEVFDTLYYNMIGFRGSLPCPEGGRIDIGERPLSEYRRTIAQLNREFRELEKH